ncbi:MAG: four helix bundle protein [Planctomycetota bacterium]
MPISARGIFSSSTREYIRYLNIAKRTTAESENWLYKMRDVGIIDKGKCNGFVGRCIEIQKMLSGLIKSLRRFSATEKE